MYNCCRNVRLTIIIGTRVRRTSTTQQWQIKDKVDYKKEKRGGNPIRCFTSLIHCRGCVRLNEERKSCVLFMSHAEGFNVGQHLSSLAYYYRVNITYYLYISGVGTYLRFFKGVWGIGYDEIVFNSI